MCSEETSAAPRWTVRINVHGAPHGDVSGAPPTDGQRLSKWFHIRSAADPFQRVAPPLRHNPMPPDEVQLARPATRFVSSIPLDRVFL
jgi:hypothetical protein